MNPEDDQNFRPSRFLLKKQQALIQQAQRLKSLKIDEQPASDHKLVFTMTPDLEKKRGASADPPKTTEEKPIEETSNLLDFSLAGGRGNDRNSLGASLKKEDKRKNMGSNIQIVMGMTNPKIKTANKGAMEIEKGKKASEIKKDTIFYPIELPLDKTSTNIPAEDFVQSLFEDKFALFQMPQILPFKEKMPNKELLNNTAKDKIERNIDIKDEGNTNELLSYLMKDNLDSMGHEINHPYTGFTQNLEEKIDEKAEKKERNLANNMNFDCDEGFLLGKLQILKDKRARMVFGDVEFEIVSGIDSKFVQELVGIDFLEKSVKPKAYFLKNIQKKFICKPNIEHLI